MPEKALVVQVVDGLTTELILKITTVLVGTVLEAVRVATILLPLEPEQLTAVTGEPEVKLQEVELTVISEGTTNLSLLPEANGQFTVNEIVSVDEAPLITDPREGVKIVSGLRLVIVTLIRLV